MVHFKTGSYSIHPVGTLPGYLYYCETVWYVIHHSCSSMGRKTLFWHFFVLCCSEILQYTEISMCEHRKSLICTSIKKTSKIVESTALGLTYEIVRWSTRQTDRLPVGTLVSSHTKITWTRTLTLSRKISFCNNVK